MRRLPQLLDQRGRLGPLGRLDQQACRLQQLDRPDWLPQPHHQRDRPRRFPTPRDHHRRRHAVLLQLAPHQGPHPRQVLQPCQAPLPRQVLPGPAAQPHQMAMPQEATPPRQVSPLHAAVVARVAKGHQPLPLPCVGYAFAGSDRGVGVATLEVTGLMALPSVRWGAHSRQATLAIGVAGARRSGVVRRGPGPLERCCECFLCCPIDGARGPPHGGGGGISSRRRLISKLLVHFSSRRLMWQSYELLTKCLGK